MKSWWYKQIGKFQFFSKSLTFLVGGYFLIQVLGVCSIKIFVENMGDPYYEPTIVVNDIGEIQYVPFHTEYEICALLRKITYKWLHLFTKLMLPLQKYHTILPYADAWLQYSEHAHLQLITHHSVLLLYKCLYFRGMLQCLML